MHIKKKKSFKFLIICFWVRNGKTAGEAGRKSHRSALTLKPLTGEVLEIDVLEAGTSIRIWASYFIEQANESVPKEAGFLGGSWCAVVSPN